LTLGIVSRGRKCAGEQEEERRACKRKEGSNRRVQLISQWGPSWFYLSLHIIISI